MRDVVPEEWHVFETASFSDLGVARARPCYTLLVTAGVADQFSEDVLVEKLLDNALTRFLLGLLLLLVAPTVGLLRVVAALV